MLTGSVYIPSFSFSNLQTENEFLFNFSVSNLRTENEFLFSFQKRSKKNDIAQYVLYNNT